MVYPGKESITLLFVGLLTIGLFTHIAQFTSNPQGDSPLDDEPCTHLGFPLEIIITDSLLSKAEALSLQARQSSHLYFYD